MKNQLLIPNIIAGCILFILTVLAFVVPYAFIGQTETVKVDASHNWYYVDNTGVPSSIQADLQDLQFDDKTLSTSIITTINSAEIRDANLVMISKNIDFSVYLNDELIYDYHPELPIYSGQSYGNAVHDIVIPNFSENAYLRIEADSLKSNLWARFENVYYQNGYQFYKELLKEHFYKLIMTFIVFVIGAFLTVLSLFIEFRTVQKTETVALGVMAITLAIYTNSDVHMLEVFASDLGLLRLLNYLSLLLLPLSGLSLVLSVIRCKKSRGMLAVQILVLFNLLLHILIIGSGLGDYNDLLIVTHSIFIVTVVVAVYHVVVAFLSKKIKEDSQLVMLIAFGLLMSCGIVDLLCFYINVSNDVARFSRLGLFVFTMVVSFYEIIQFLEMSRKSYEAEIMHKLAHEDGLTGLENRMSFSEYEKEMKLRTDGLVYIIQLDINYLKKVNDTYGHSAGDKHIIAAANIIRNVFGEYGRIFRTGGDEFIVTMESSSVMNLGKVYRECERRFKDEIEEYNKKENPPVKLSIAYGMGELRCGKDNPEDIEKKADERMYENKLMLKKQVSC